MKLLTDFSKILYTKNPHFLRQKRLEKLVKVFFTVKDITYDRTLINVSSLFDS